MYPSVTPEVWVERKETATAGGIYRCVELRRNRWVLPVAVIRTTKDHRCLLFEGEEESCHLLDLYLPYHRNVLEKPRPLIIWIHGGAWSMGDKRATPVAILPLVGYVGASINYRLTDQAKFPAQLDDCRRALAYLINHCQEYGIDPRRIGLWGLSSGGQLACLLALAPDESSSDNSSEGGAKVRAICEWAAPTDFSTITSQARPGNLLKLDSIDGPVSKLLGGLPKDCPTAALNASPVHYVHPHSPPFYIIHGSLDNTVPPEQSKEFAAVLTKNAVANELHIVSNAAHDLTGSDLVWDSIHFFDRTLK